MKTRQGSAVVPIHVATVDDNAATRCSLQQIIEACGFACVGSYESSEEALREVPAANPHLVLMEIRLPRMCGIECMRQLRQTLPDLRVVLVSAATDTETLEKAVDAGADAFLTKPFSPAQGMATLRFSVRNLDCRGAARTATSAPPLTEKEMAVMTELARGLLYKEIGVKLGISFSAVHKHQHRIFSKLGVGNRTEAISKWRDVSQRFASPTISP